MSPNVAPQDRYWDSDAFLAFLRDEEGRADECQAVIQGAREGRVRIVTSALTLAEVVMLPGHDKLAEAAGKTIRALFANEWIVLRDVDRFIAQKAQDLVWTYRDLRPKDAIHVATALEAGVACLDTYDKVLLSLSGKVGDPPLVIGRPGDGMQFPLAAASQSPSVRARQTEEHED